MSEASGSSTGPTDATPPPDEADTDRRWCLVAVPLILVVPFVLYLRHNDYALLRVEVLVAIVILSLVGLVIGLAAARAPLSIRLAILWVSLAVFADLQFASVRNLRTLAALVGAGILMAAGRRRVAQTLAAMFAAMLVVTVFGPAGAEQVSEARATEPPTPAAELPLRIHIILDEHIGVEGIPGEFDPDNVYREQLLDIYLSHDFDVWGGAYSQFWNTGQSIPQMMSLSSASPHDEQGRTGSEDSDQVDLVVRENPYFDALSAEGYRLHVYQTDYLDLCGGYEGDSIDYCSSSTIESPKALQSADIDLMAKVDGLLGTFFRLSPEIRENRARYEHLDRWFGDHLIGLPDWRPKGIGRVSALSAVQDFDRVESSILDGAPGEAYIVHLMLPHYPLAYDRDCVLNSRPDEWLSGDAPEAAPRRNNVVSRQLRYPRYLEQMSCAGTLIDRLLDRLDASGKLDDAVVLVHGDHGSRLDTGPPTADLLGELSDADFSDGYSTLFASHVPGGEARYDTEMMPLPDLVAATMTGAPAPIAPREPTVFLLPPNSEDQPNQIGPSVKLPVFPD